MVDIVQQALEKHAASQSTLLGTCPALKHARGWGLISWNVGIESSAAHLSMRSLRRVRYTLLSGSVVAIAAFTTACRSCLLMSWTPF